MSCPSFLYGEQWLKNLMKWCHLHVMFTTSFNVDLVIWNFIRFHPVVSKMGHAIGLIDTSSVGIHFFQFMQGCIKLFTCIQKHRSACFPYIVCAVLFILSCNFQPLDFMCSYHSAQYILFRITRFLNFIHIPYLNRVLDIYKLSVTPFWQETASVCICRGS